MNIKILVVEDDKHIREVVRAYLLESGYQVETCADGNDALEKLYDNKYHLVILDIMLPGINGHDLLKELRKLDDTPVLIISALDDSSNQIRAFTNEADDYVVKPFTVEVLLKRVEAILRHSNVLKKEIRWGRLILYPESYRAEYDGIDLRLTLKEYDILRLLIQIYREDKARSSGQGRSGLGLAIVKKMLDCMAMHFNIENTEEGVLFWIDLPVCDVLY